MKIKTKRNIHQENCPLEIVFTDTQNGIEYHIATAMFSDGDFRLWFGFNATCDFAQLQEISNHLNAVKIAIESKAVKP